MADPKYVRLHDRLVNGMLADVEGSDFSIAGYDVVPFPEDDNPQAQSFVRDHLQSGNLERAAKAEHTEVHQHDDLMHEVRPIETPVEQLSTWQENHIQRIAKASHKKVAAGRARRTASGGSPEDDSGDDGSEEPKRRARSKA